jgi:hypothetical protein
VPVQTADPYDESVASLIYRLFVVPTDSNLTLYRTPADTVPDGDTVIAATPLTLTVPSVFILTLLVALPELFPAK